MLDVKELLAKMLTSLNGVDVSAQITFNSAWTQMDKKVWNFGGLIIFQLEGYASTFYSGNAYTLATIASGYRPAAINYASGHQVDSSFNPKGTVNALIRPTGAIEIRTETGSSTAPYIILCGAYRIA